MGTYSFLNVQATLAGPGGNISLGNGSGSSEEGITVEMLEDKDAMVVGADGQIMHSLRASNAGRVTVRLLKTSPINAMLSALYNFQRQNSMNWGRNTLVVSDTIRGDVISGDTIAFAKHPVITYSKDANMNEWSFLGNVDELLGTGVPNVNV